MTLKKDEDTTLTQQWQRQLIFALKGTNKQERADFDIILETTRLNWISLNILSHEAPGWNNTAGSLLQFINLRWVGWVRGGKWNRHGCLFYLCYEKLVVLPNIHSLHPAEQPRQTYIKWISPWCVLRLRGSSVTNGLRRTHVWHRWEKSTSTLSTLMAPQMVIVCVCVCWEWDRCRETELMRCWISVVECSPGCHVRDCRLCFVGMWPLEHEAIINWFMYSVEHMCWFYGKYYWEVYCVFRVCVRLLETMCACMCKIIDWISTAFLSNNCLGIWSALVLPVHWLQSHFLVHTCTHTRS